MIKQHLKIKSFWGQCRKLTDNPDGYCSQHELQNDESGDTESEKDKNEKHSDN